MFYFLFMFSCREFFSWKLLKSVYEPLAPSTCLLIFKKHLFLFTLLLILLKKNFFLTNYFFEGNGFGADQTSMEALGSFLSNNCPALKELNLGSEINWLFVVFFIFQNISPFLYVFSFFFSCFFLYFFLVFSFYFLFIHPVVVCWF